MRFLSKVSGKALGEKCLKAAMKNRYNRLIDSLKTHQNVTVFDVDEYDLACEILKTTKPIILSANFRRVEKEFPKSCIDKDDETRDVKIKGRVIINLA